MLTFRLACLCRIIPFLSVFWALLFPCHAAQFTAELTISSSREHFVYDLKVKDNLIRFEKIQGPMTVPPFPTIFNRSTGVAWGLNPQMRQYVEEADPVKTMMMNPIAGWEFMRKDLKGTLAGDETVAGYVCRVVEYRKSGNPMVSNRVWVSPDLDFTVKEIAYGMNGSPTMELRNIRTGPVDAALFKIPPGYTKADGASGSADPSPRKPAKASGNILFILDASGSMWGQVDGTAKIDIAKEVLTGLIRELPDDAAVGLVAYGHRRKGDCDDVEELVAPGPLDKEKIVARILSLSPKGKTPISRSVRLTAECIKGLEDETTIILVSDGKETCDPDPCGLVKELKASGIKFVMHVIGFDVTEEEREQLECMARAGGGSYYTAGNAGEFLAAAREVVEAPTFTGGYLKVNTLKEGQPFEAHAEVFRQSDNQNMGDKNTWYGEQPAEYKLVPGTYVLQVTDRSVTPFQRQEIRDIEIVSGQTVEKTLTFGGAGLLRITAVKEGQPFEAHAEVFRQSDNQNMGDKNTWYGEQPAEYKLVPDTYALKVTDRSVTPFQHQEIRDIEIVSGQTVEKTLTFGGAGLLRITAVKEGQPFEAHAEVFRQSDNRNMGDKNTWYGEQPAEYKLVPGTYVLQVTDRSVTPFQRQEIRDIEIVSGQTVEKKVDFVAGGVLRITATRNGQPFEAQADVIRQSDNKGMGGKNTWYRQKPAEYKLVPDTYALKVTDRSVTPFQRQEIRDIEIVSGQTVEKKVDFVAGGVLRITATRNGQPFEAQADVIRQSDNKGMGGKNTWYRQKPAEYKLVPGIYYIKVYDRATKERKEIRDVEIVSGQAVGKTVAF